MHPARIAQLLAGCALLCLFSCQKLKVAVGVECAEFDFGLPPDVRPPPQPAGTCMKPVRVELGRRLFYDKKLSLNQTQSCASCHIQERAFTDGRAHAVGSTGQIHPRNAQGLTNAGYLSRFTWANPQINRLENQVLVPVFSEDTSTTVIELGLAGHEHTLAQRLRSDPEYVRLFTEAYGKDKIDVTRIAKALAVFQTTFVSYRSDYDRGSISEGARRGEKVFRSEKAGCASCHGGWNFNEDDQGPGASYVNIGLYNIAGKGDYPDAALHREAGRATQGLFVITGKAEDRGKFRIPSLRNAAVTAPYMHDGSIATLEEAIEHFNQGGRWTGHAGDGRANPNKDPRVRFLGLSEQEKRDLVEFLRSLTDECFLTDSRFSDPSRNPPVQPVHCR